MDTRTWLILVFHLSAGCVYFAADINFTFKPLWEQLGKLTVWDMWLQFLFFGLSVIIDIGTLRNRVFPKLIYFRDRIFTSLAVPFSQFVFIMYWGLLVTMRKLKNPQATISNSWTNHVSHTIILPIAFINMRLIRHHYSRTSDGLTVSVLFGIIYLSMAIFQGHTQGYFPYSIIGDLNYGTRSLFFVGCTGLICLFYLIGERINICMWGVDEPKVFDDTRDSFSRDKDDDVPALPLHIEMTEVTVESHPRITSQNAHKTEKAEDKPAIV